MRKRDSQRSKLYRAEDRVPGYRTAYRFETLAQVADFVDSVYANAEVEHLWPEQAKKAQKNALVLPKRHGRATAFASRPVIYLPKWAWCKGVVLHEIAHTLVNACRNNLQAHGVEFCECFLLLLRKFIGQEMHDAMKNSFLTAGVKCQRPVEKYRPAKITRNISQERREQLAARMREIQKLRWNKKDVAAEHS